MGRGYSLVKRILTRLERAEAHEANPHLQDDYRIAWITVLYAWRGRAEPHVCATYAVLGLHPDKVWPAIRARRKALLGGEYDNFFAGPAPKKPPQSVGLDQERIRRLRTASGELPPAQDLPLGEGRGPVSGKKTTARVVSSRREKVLLFERPLMASTALAYPNPNLPNRAKNPARAPFSRVDQVLSSTLPSHLQNTLRWLLRFNKFGSELWASTNSLAACAFKSRRTIQHHLDELTEELYDCQSCSTRQSPSERSCCRRCGSERIRSTGMRVLEMLHEANSWVRYGGRLEFRHTATYRFNAAALAPRKTYEQYAEERAAQRPKRTRAEKQAEQPAAQQSPVLVAEPKREAERSAHHSDLSHSSHSQPSHSQPRKLTSRECSKLVALVKEYKQGRLGHVEETSGLWIRYSSGDPRYRPPLNQEEAIVAACKELGAPIESAIEALKLAGWKVGNA